MPNELNTCELDALGRRIRHLELTANRQAAGLRRWRFAACGLLGVFVSAMLAGGAALSNRVFEANAFLLRASDGSLRGSFVVGDDGGVRLTLLDRNATARAGMWLDATGRATSWGFENSMHASSPPMDAAPRGQAPSISQPQFNGVSAQGASLMQRATPSSHSTFAANRIYATQPVTQNAPSHVPPTIQAHASMPIAAGDFQQPAYEQTMPVPYTNGKLIMLASGARVLEQNKDLWTFAYQIALRNDTGTSVDQAFHVIFVDANGFVLGRQARIVRLGPGREMTLNGELDMAPDRARQVANVKLNVWQP